MTKTKLAVWVLDYRTGQHELHLNYDHEFRVDGVIRSLDPSKPVFDKARYAVDLSTSYGFHWFSDKVRARVQLNVRDVFENGRIQAVAVNPDRSVFAARIIDPRQFILSISFEL